MKEQENNQDNLAQIKEDEATKEAVNKEDKVDSVEFVKEELQKEKAKIVVMDVLFFAVIIFRMKYTTARWNMVLLFSRNGFTNDMV